MPVLFRCSSKTAIFSRFLKVAIATSNLWPKHIIVDFCQSLAFQCVYVSIICVYIGCISCISNGIYIVLFALLRTLFMYLPFPVRYGKKCFFSIIGKSSDTVVQIKFIFLFIYIVNLRLFNTWKIFF